jgi:plastocyanin
MPIARLSRRAAALAGMLSALSAAAGASGLQIQVLDADGAPVPGVAVFASPTVESGTPKAVASRAVMPATMNQSDLAFSPHLLIVETGTPVAFPNDDDVRHHVYSFSPASRFQMTIDSQSVHSEEIVFDTAGIVTLGCNIHDNMLAYVLVVDTPYFATTDAAGTVSLSVPGTGEVEIHVWTPRLSEGELPGSVMVDLAAGEALEVTFQFDDKLYPPHEHSDTSLHWSDY